DVPNFGVRRSRIESLQQRKMERVGTNRTFPRQPYSRAMPLILFQVSDGSPLRESKKLRIPQSAWLIARRGLADALLSFVVPAQTGKGISASGAQRASMP